MINILKAKNNQERTICTHSQSEMLHFRLNMKINYYIFYKVALYTF